MEDELNEFPWMTAAVVVIGLIVALVGGAVVVFGDAGALSFSEYVEVLVKFAIGAGLLGVGRGIRAHGLKTRVRR